MTSFRWADFWIVRSPLLPADFPLGGREESLTSVAARIVAHATIRRALKTASPSLVSALEEGTHQDTAARHALIRYVERMRARATPFALLAGYSVIAHGSEADPESRGPLGVRLAARERYRHIVRLDVETVARVVQADALARRDEVRWMAKADLVFFPDLVRVVKRGNDASLTYEDIDRSPEIDVILQLGRKPRPLRELARALPERYSESARTAFLRELVDMGVLIPESLPALMGEDELGSLAKVPSAEGLLKAASDARSTPLGERDDRLLVLEEALRALAPAPHEPSHGEPPPSEPSSPAASSIVHDLLKPVSSAGLGTDEGELRKLAELLLSILPAAEPDPRLTDFREYFLRRYEGREVRLVDALDEDRGYEFPMPSEPTSSRAAVVHVIRCLRDRARDGRIREVELTDSDLVPLCREHVPTTSAALTCKLAVDVQGHLEAWDPMLLTAPGSALFARATGIDRDLRERTRRWLDEARDPRSDVEEADVAYFVIGKTGAVSQYPTLLRSEITLTSVTSSDASIDVNDLLVSVRGDGFVLRNARTGRRVVIRRTSAVIHTRADTTSVARFLDALWNAETPGVSPELSSRDDPFFPRVRWGRHVLSSARWRIDAADFEPVRAAPEGERPRALAALRARLGLPRHVLFEEKLDHFLHVDLDCPFSVGAWLDIMKAATRSKSPVRLRECFPFERSAVTGPEGPFVHEAVFPFTLSRPKQKPAKVPVSPRPVRPSPRDDVLPGGPWLYLEVPGSRQELLRLLVELADDVLGPLRSEGVLSHWFYLPYAAPDPHVRIRAKGDPAVLLQTVFPRLREALEPALERGVVRDVALRTYERETYRYGGPRGMDLTEQVWFHSGTNVIERLRELDDVLGLELEDVVLELVMVHARLLEHTPLSVKKKRDVAALAFAHYHRSDEPIEARRTGSGLYRKLRARLAFEPPAPNADLERLFVELEAGTKSNAIERPFLDLLADYLHTQTFRMITGWHPLADVESIAYVVLEKCYASLAARDTS